MTFEISVKPKRINVFENGNSPEKVFFVHPKCRLNWSSILEFITIMLKPKHGPISCLRNESGTKIISSFDDLEDGGKYIACGKEPFVSVPGGYKTESELSVAKSCERSTSSEIFKAIGGNVNYLTDTNQLNIITIYVFINGQKIKPRKISLLKTVLKNWETILEIISEKMDQIGSIKKIYTIFGEKLENPEQLQHRGFYVALFEDCEFENISYLSVFSTKESKRRFRKTRQTSTYSQDIGHFAKEELPKEVPNTKKQDARCDRNALNENDLAFMIDNLSENQFHHLTLVQKPFSPSKNTPGVPSTICAKKTKAKLILEAMSENDCSKYPISKTTSTQTSNIYVNVNPCGKCVIELGSKRYHVIADNDAQPLPSGVFFSARSSLKEVCEIPYGQNVIGLKNIADYIVGVVVDTSEFVVNKSIYGDNALEGKDSKLEKPADFEREELKLDECLVDQKQSKEFNKSRLQKAMNDVTNRRCSNKTLQEKTTKLNNVFDKL